MKKQLLLLLLLLPVITFGQLTQANVQDTINLYIKSPLGVTPVKKTFTALNQFAGQSSVTANSTTTFTNKTMDGGSNTFTNIPYSALTGTPTIPTNYITTNSNQTGLTGDKTTAGLWNFTAPFSTGQASFGSTGNGALINLKRGSDGATGVTIGYSGQNSTTGYINAGAAMYVVAAGDNVIQSTGSGGSVSLEANHATGFLNFKAGNAQAARLFSNGSLRIGTSITLPSSKFHVDGSAYIGANLDVNGDIGNAGNILSSADNTYNVGAVATNYANIYVRSIISGANLTFNKPVGSGIYFRNGATSSIIGGLHLTTGNFFLQSSSSIPTDTGEKLQVSGTTKLDGAVSTTGSLTMATGTGINGYAINLSGLNVNAASVHRPLMVYPTINQSGTGGYSLIYTSPYEQTLGSGVKYLLQLTTNSAANNAGTVTNRFLVTNTGRLIIKDVPVYTDNTAATSAGLEVGTVYKTALGVMMIVY